MLVTLRTKNTLTYDIEGILIIALAEDSRAGLPEIKVSSIKFVYYSNGSIPGLSLSIVDIIYRPRVADQKKTYILSGHVR